MVRSNNRRTSLLLGGAGLAMAAALVLPSPAQADAFNGTPSFVRGTGNVDRSVTDVDTITITSSTAVIDWTIFEDNFGNGLTFLPNGRTAYFQDAPGQGGFAVLNRILPSTNGNVVVFQGSVISRLQDASGSFSNGGTVAFYSPTGILVGSNAVFDVGQLLLTTLDPDLDSFESFAGGGTLQLIGSPGQTAGVTIATGAQITAGGEGSAFAVVAPQITMRGSAYINGSTAYVAGEQVNLSYNNGLFDIQIPVGTSVANPIDHRGTTGGPSSTGTGDNHLIYAVAKAATDPITMLLRGNLGFDTAATAGIDNGDIILSAGYDVFGRSVTTGPVNSTAVEESIAILGSANLSSSVFGAATGSFTANSNGGTIAFGDGLAVEAARSISLVARNGNDLTITGDASFDSEGTIDGSDNVLGGTIKLNARDGATLSVTGALSATTTPGARTGTATGGEIELQANGGTLTVAGDVLLSSKVNRFFSQFDQGDSFGGTARLYAQNDGFIGLGGGLTIEADAFGFGDAGANATGGTSEIVAVRGGQIDIAGSADLSAFGTGGRADGTVGVIDGGIGTGGFARIVANGGSINLGSTLSMRAEGTGGDGASFFGTGPGGDTGGIGRGGEVLINSIDGSITIADSTQLLARGFGGRGGTGGAAFGGLAQVFADGTGTINLADVSGSAHGLGGNGSEADGRGGDGEGGRSIIVTEGAGNISITGSANMQANAFGGNGHDGGDAVGGNAGIYAIFGDISITGDAYLSAIGSGGDATAGFGGNGGNAIGGTSYVQADGSETTSASLSIGGNATAVASGFGGIGGAGDGGSIAAGSGGNGTGGTFQGAPGTGGAFALAGRDNATLTVGGSTLLLSRGFGGAGGVGGTGQSGGAGGIGTGGTTQAGTFSARGDGTLGEGVATFAALTLDASGSGGGGGSGDGGLGAGGDGIGGFAGVFAIGSQVDAGRISTLANGSGGFGSTGGDGTGGGVGIGVVSGVLNASSALARANGVGGGATTGDAGDGTGGEASIDVDSTLNVTGDIDYFATGSGGQSQSGNGGSGQGGVARISTASGANLTVGGFADLFAFGGGGSGLVGGNATGGIAIMEVQDNSVADLGSLQVSAYGTAGSGQEIGGRGIGGDARLVVNGGQFVSSGSVSADAYGSGGSGLDGGDGGDGFGGIAGLNVNRGDVSIASSFFAYAGGVGGDAVGFGGDGGDGYGGRASLSIFGDATGMGTVTVGNSLQLYVVGIGGDGGDGDGDAIAAGNGGLGQGGLGEVASMVDPALGTGSYLLVSGDYGQLTAPGSTTVYSIGQGGDGGDAPAGQAGGIGGAGIGGDNLIGLVGLTDGGPRMGRADFGDFFSYSYAFGGSGGTDLDGNYTGLGGEATGGYILVAGRGGTLTADSISLNDIAFGGAGSTGGNAFGGQAGMTTADGGTIEVGTYYAGSIAYGGLGQSGRGGDALGGTAFLGFQGGNTTVTGSATIDTSGYGGQSIGGDGGDGTGGTADIAVFSAVQGNGSVVGPATIIANGFGGGTQSANGIAGTGTGGLAYVRSRAGGNVTFGSVSLLANGNSGFDASGTQSGGANGGLVQVLADGGGTLTADFLQLDASGADTAGSLEIFANGGTIAINNLFAQATGAAAGEASLIRATNGSIPISGVADITLTGDLNIVTSNGGLIGGPTVANPTASLFLSSDGVVTIDGDNDDQISFGGQNLFIRSRDLDILSGARIGAEFLGFSVVGNDNITVIGGNTDTPGYTLTQAELGRIEAGAASFSTSFDGMASDDLLFRDTIIFGSLDDGVYDLSIEARVVRVEGMVTYREAAATDYFGIFADRLEIVTPGGIQILDPSGNLTGTFEFEGGNFWMADADTIARLREDVAFDGRNDLLATAAAGSDDPLGYLRAGDVLIDIGESFLVRNTGTPAAPGGITVTGTLTIDGDGVEFPIDAFAYGRRQNSDGSFATGEAFFELIDFTGGEESDPEDPVTYDDNAQFNNCGINSGECAVIEQPEVPEVPDEREEVLDEVEEEAPAAAVTTTEPIAAAPVEQSEQDTNVEFGADFPSLVSATLVADQELIDDPVTSGGDIALYGAGEEASEEEEGGDDTDAQ